MRVLPLVLLTALLWQPAWADDADSTRVAVVFGSRSFHAATPDEAALVRTFSDTVTAALEAMGVAYDSLDDSDVANGDLARYEVAILPYSFVIPEEESEAIERHVRSGGTLIVFYGINERLADLLGLDVGARVGGDFRSVRLDVGRLEGLPKSIEQNSWNIRRAAPNRPDAQVIGEWIGPDDEPLHEPALIVSANGAYMGHVLTAGDVANKGRMLQAILSHFAPEVGTGAGLRACAAASAELDRLERRLKRAPPDSENGERARKLLSDARQQLARAWELATNGRDSQAVAIALQARERAEPIYWLCAAQRHREFRGVWLHNAYGLPGWGWERTLRHLRRSGFNGIMANMLWAGLAHFPSDYLPVSLKASEQGDQIAESLRWAKEFGVDLHVWKVNFNLENAPQDFVNRLREEKRLQQHLDGSEIPWLCPSDPRNLALERDSMLEVVRKYDVAGIHLDYIRYPHEEACFCEGCRRRFEEAVGVTIERWPDDVLREPLGERFAQWRRDQITKLVRAVATEARQVRPGIMISAAVFDWPASRDWAGQDWKQWIDEGLLDFVCPMDYTPSTEFFESLIARQVATVGGRVPVYAGIGEFLISDPDVLIDQIESARRRGADGFICFSYEHAASTENRLPVLSASLTADAPGVSPHPAPGVRFDLPRPISGPSGLAYPAHSEMTVQVALSKQGNYPAPIARADGLLGVESAEVERVQDLGRISSQDCAPFTAHLRLPPGRYRLIVRGTVSFAASGARQFVARSRPFEMLPTDQAPEIPANGEPTP
jgi:uncharacterized lipoprotein YddW (UPF0748 family)